MWTSRRKKDLNLRKKLYNKLGRLNQVKVEKTKACEAFQQELVNLLGRQMEKYSINPSIWRRSTLEIAKVQEKIEDLDTDLALKESKDLTVGGVQGS